jgi:hypothetical protein
VLNFTEIAQIAHTLHQNITKHAQAIKTVHLYTRFLVPTKDVSLNLTPLTHYRNHLTPKYYWNKICVKCQHGFLNFSTRHIAYIYFTKPHQDCDLKFQMSKPILSKETIYSVYKYFFYTLQRFFTWFCGRKPEESIRIKAYPRFPLNMLAVTPTKPEAIIGRHTFTGTPYSMDLRNRYKKLEQIFYNTLLV